MSLAIKNLTKEELIDKYFEQEKKINELNRNIKNLSNELSLANNLFEYSPTPMWEEDITDLMNHIEDLKKNGIVNFREYFNENPNELIVCIDKIQPINVNSALVNLHKAKSKEELLNNFDQVFIEEALGAFKNEIVAIANGETSYICLTKAKTFTNEILDLKLYLEISKSVINSSLKYTAIVSTVNITEQKKAEDKLFNSEKALRTILDSTEDIAILLDPNGFILESNRACQEFYNVKKIDLVGRKLSYFGTDEVVENRRLYFRRAKIEKKTITFKNSGYNKIWMSTISPILDSKGDVEKLVIFHKDITSKHYSEKKLRDSELKFKSIFNNIQTSIVHIDHEGFITDINEYHLKHISKSKRTKQDYIGSNILERPSLLKAGIIDYYKKLLEGNQFDVKNVYFPVTTGEDSAYFNIQGIPLFDSDKILGAIITTEDVTEEVTSNQKIMKIEQRLSLALEGAGIGFWEEDIANNKFIRSNHWFEMLGYQKSEFSDGIEVWQNLVHPDDLHESQSIVKKHYNGEIDQIRIEHRLKNSQNNYQWILNWGKVIERDEAGNPVRSAGIHLDFTEEKKANEVSILTQQKYKYLFDNQPTVIWEEDFSVVKNKLDALKEKGITDFKSYFIEHPEFLMDCAKEIKIVEMNQASLKILEAENMNELYDSIPKYFDSKDAWDVFGNELTALAEGALNFESEIWIKTTKGNKKYLYLTLNVNLENQDTFKSILVSFQDITERKITEEKNRYLAKLLESSPLAYTVTDLSGSITDVNPALETLTGYSKIELIGQNPEIFNAENNANEIQKNIFETLAKNKIWDGEILNKKKNGELFYNHTTIFPLINENGEPYSFAAFNEDVTERIHSNNIIREQDEYVKSIFSSAPVGIGVVINRVFNKVNLKLCEMTGYNQEELIGKSSEILYPTLEEFKRVGHQKYSQIDRIGTGTLETQFKTKGGAIIDVLLSSTPIDKIDLLKGVTFAALDITERKQNEKSLRQYEHIVANSSDMLALVDNKYKYLAVNQAYLDWFNLSQEELIGKTVQEVLGDNFFKTVMKPNADICMNGERVNYQEWIDFPKSKNAYMDISYFPYKDDKNNIRGFVVNGRNITESKLSDEALNEQMRINEQILTTSMDGYILADTNGNIIDVNPSYSSMIGYTKEELQSMNIAAVEIELPKKTIEHRIQQMISLGGLNFKTKHKHKLGHAIDLDVSSTVIKKKNGLLIATLVRDITEQIKAEIKIRESEDKFSKIFKMTPYVLIISRIIDGKLLDFNDYTMDIVGLRREEMLNKTSTELGLISFEQRSILTEKIHSQGFFSNIELEVTLPSGEKRIGLFHGRQIKLGNEDCIFQTILDITDRIKAEQQVRESEEKFHKIFRNSPDSIVLTKMDGGEIVEVNDATLKITDVELEKLVGKKTADIFVWENLSNRNRYIEKLAEYNRVYDYEANFRMKNGDIRNCLIAGELIKINNIDYILSIIRDVTEKKKSEIALVESESKYRMLVENQSDLVVEVDKSNQFTFVSPSYCRLFGKSEKELLGKSFYPQIHEDDRTSTEEEMKKLFYEPFTCRIEQRAMTLQGWRWLEWNDTAQLDDENNVKSILGVGRDITDKKESELALIASEEKFYKIFKNSPDAIILTRMEDGEVIDVNDATTEITGYKHSEIVGKITTQIQLWDKIEDRDRYVDILKKVGIAKSLTVNFNKKNGEKRIGMLSGVLLELNNKKLVFGILRDVTEKTIFEKKLQDTNERLRNLTRYMNNVREEERKNFAREVHDNLGQKLTALNLDISWIKQSIPEELTELSEQFNPVLELINQSIITVQKISTELRPGILDDLGLINAIQWQSNEISRRTDLKFSLNLYKNELELDDKVKTAIFRVYQEALTNIVRHAEAKNVSVNLLIKENNLIFEVIDDGKGISQADINEFTSFGIIGMKERINSIDGEIFFSNLNNGTMLQIKVPITEL